MAEDKTVKNRCNFANNFHNFCDWQWDTNLMLVAGDSIVSSLGYTTDENYLSVRQALTASKLHSQMFDLPFEFFGAILDRNRIDTLFNELQNVDNQEYTFFEKIALLSIYSATKNAQISINEEDTLLILSTTKGNVELLEKEQSFSSQSIFLWKSAQLLAYAIGSKQEPIVVSNACISGLSAQHLAEFYLRTHRCKYAIVVGADVLSKFIISGFESFKALSKQICRPFDRQRNGLNLGEAAACIIYTLENQLFTKNNAKAVYLKGAVCNDATHISAPSRTADGLIQSIEVVLQNIDKQDIAFISAHGTATIYNDAMEAFALNKLRLNHLPINSLKPYFGHTLGAAGVLETILSYRALRDGIVFKNPTFEQTDEHVDLYIPVNEVNTDGKYCLKLMSGFGGSNAAILMVNPLKLTDYE
ncbi:MAG: beta-ketoacyl synthase [Bacteroidales bacterium]|jgi:3-oxoacyl-[acyl-carrier-protein] synthase-1|nr:beta-ketoacyl synthase [Bacteroidales bacterium]